MRLEAFFGCIRRPILRHLPSAAKMATVAHSGFTLWKIVCHRATVMRLRHVAMTHWAKTDLEDS